MKNSLSIVVHKVNGMHIFLGRLDVDGGKKPILLVLEVGLNFLTQSPS